MRYSCEVCKDGFVSKRYQDWVNHLLSPRHQNEVRWKQPARKQWRSQTDSYVLTGIPNGLPCSKYDLADWLSSFGMLSEFYYDFKRQFCVFTLDSCGMIGWERSRLIVEQKEFRNTKIIIKPKAEYGPLEWDLIFNAVEDIDEPEPTSNAKAGKLTSSNSNASSASVGRPRNDSTTSLPTSSSQDKIPKGTLVFTNKTRSSSNQDVVKAINEKAKDNKSESSMSSNNINSAGKGQRKLGKGQAASSNHAAVKNVDGQIHEDTKEGSRKKKKRNKKRTKETDRANGITGGNHESDVRIQNNFRTSITPSTATSATAPPKGNQKVAVSSFVNSELPHTSTAKSENTKESIAASALRSEPLNFRGGFTHSRRQEARVSESSATTDPVLHQQEQALPTQIHVTKNNDGQRVEQSQYKVLQRVIDNTDKKSRNQNSKTSSNSTNSSGNGRNQQDNRTSSSKLGNPRPSPRATSMRYVGAGPAHLHIKDLISPVFFSQVPNHVRTCLSNPCGPGRNPYLFSETGPPFPHFFEFFQEISADPSKMHKSRGYKQFLKLTITDQLVQFLLAQSLPLEEVRLRWQVIMDMLFILRQHYPYCEIYAFGSIVTGLGDFSSDIDVYVDLNGETTSPTPLDPSQRLTSHQALDIARRIIKKSACPHTNRNFSRQLIPVKSARVPILKMTHSVTKISCDLSFENRLSVQNTKMMSLFLHLDPRVSPLMVLLRYWGKWNGFTGSNYIKNYALALLVYVYFVRNQVLPTVELLQKLKAQERKDKRIQKNPDEIGEWDASFCDNLQLINAHFRRSPAPESFGYNPAPILIHMAVEFFEMFANIDFSKVVVCTLLGQIIPKKQFVAGNEESLPDSLDRYKNWAVKQEMNRRLNINTCLCIQDPFLLSYNVGGVTPLGTLIRFQIACAKTAQELRKSEAKSILDILIPLPLHIGDKKFMKVYKTEYKQAELKREIKLALGESVDDENEKSTKQQKHQGGHTSKKSSFVDLPSHLSSLEKLIDEKVLKTESKKPKWGTFMDFDLHSQFESILVTELTRYKIQGPGPILKDKLCALWKEFAIDFLNDIFVKGLKLKVERKEVSEEAYIFDDSQKKSEGWRRWTIKIPSVEKPTKEKTKSLEDVDILCKKVMELPATPVRTYYKIFCVKVHYPFWEKRESLLKTVIKELKKDDEVKAQEQVIVSPSRKKGKKKKEDGDGWYITCINPIEIESRVSDMILDSYKTKTTVEVEKETFPCFEFRVLIKLDLSSPDERPKIIFLFEKITWDSGTADASKANLYIRALSSVADMLSEAFPAYQIYRLCKWLNLTSLEMEKIVVSSNVDSDEKPQPADEDEGATLAETESGKKKSGRTKLEEELLIPSSSSSTCSSPVPSDDGDGYETISDDDEELEKDKTDYSKSNADADDSVRKEVEVSSVVSAKKE